MMTNNLGRIDLRIFSIAMTIFKIWDTSRHRNKNNKNLRSLNLLISLLNNSNKIYRRCIKLEKELNSKKYSMLRKNKGKRRIEDNKEIKIQKISSNQEDLVQVMMLKKTKRVNKILINK